MPSLGMLFVWRQMLRQLRWLSLEAMLGPRIQQGSISADDDI